MRLLLHKSDLVVGLANVARCTPGSIVLADNLPDLIGYVDQRPLPKKHGRVRRVRVEQLKIQEVVDAVQVGSTEKVGAHSGGDEGIGCEEGGGVRQEVQGQESSGEDGHGECDHQESQEEVVQVGGYCGQGHFDDQSKQLEVAQKLRDQGVI